MGRCCTLPRRSRWCVQDASAGTCTETETKNAFTIWKNWGPGIKIVSVSRSAAERLPSRGRCIDWLTDGSSAPRLHLQRRSSGLWPLTPIMGPKRIASPPKYNRPQNPHRPPRPDPACRCIPLEKAPGGGCGPQDRAGGRKAPIWAHMGRAATGPIIQSGGPSATGVVMAAVSSAAAQRRPTAAAVVLLLVSDQCADRRHPAALCPAPLTARAADALSWSRIKILRWAPFFKNTFFCNLRLCSKIAPLVNGTLN